MYHKSMDKKVKNYIFISYYFLPNLGGIESSIDAMAKYLSGQKSSSLVFTSKVKRNSNKLLDSYSNNGIYKISRIRTFQKNKLLSLFLIDRLIFGFRLRRRIISLSKKNYCICISRDHFSSLFLLSIKNIKVVSLPPSVCFHESLYNYKAKLLRQNIKKVKFQFKQLTVMIIQSFISYILQYLAFLSSDKIIVSSQIFKKRLLGIFPCKNIKEAQVLKFPLFKLNLKRNYESIGIDNKDDNVIRFLTVSRLCPLKNIDLSIRTISLLQQKCNVKIKYHIYGEGEDLEYLYKIIKELNVGKFIKIITGFDSSKIDWQKYHYFLFTSSCESYANTINESISQFLPIVGFQSQARNKNFIVRTATSEILGEAYKEFGLLAKEFNGNSLYNSLLNSIKIINNGEYENLINYLITINKEMQPLERYMKNILNMIF